MGILHQRDYYKRAFEDKRLPSYPEDYYGHRKEWISWMSFLDRDNLSKQIGRKKYSSYEEASQAARSLMIYTSGEYRVKYRLDTKLPYQPYKTYKNDWVSWASFLRD